MAQSTAVSSSANVTLLFKDPVASESCGVQIAIVNLNQYENKTMEDVYFAMFQTIQYPPEEMDKFEIHCVVQGQKIPERYDEIVRDICTVPLTETTMKMFRQRKNSIGSASSKSSFSFLCTVPNRKHIAEEVAKVVTFQQQLNPWNDKLKDALARLVEEKRTFAVSSSHRQKEDKFEKRSLICDRVLAEELIRLGVLESLLECVDRGLTNSADLIIQRLHVTQILAELVRYALSDRDDDEDEQQGLFSWHLITFQIIQHLCQNLDLDYASTDSNLFRYTLKILHSFAKHNVGQRISFITQHVTMIRLSQIFIHFVSVNMYILYYCITLMNVLIKTANPPTKAKHMSTIVASHLRDHLSRAYVILSKEPRDCFSKFQSALQELFGYMLEVTREESLIPVRLDSNFLEFEGIKKSAALYFRPMSSDTQSRFSQLRDPVDSQFLTPLGFTNPKHPEVDFSKTPPGLLALKLTSYLTLKTEVFQKLCDCLANSKDSQSRFPLIQVAVALTEILLQVFGSSEDGSFQFFPIMLSMENPYQECFVILIETFYQTWIESKARQSDKQDDLQKVASVLKDQFLEALSHHPENASQLQTELSKLPYDKFKQQIKTENFFYSTKVDELLKRNVKSLIITQRLNGLKNGCTFNELDKRLKNKGVTKVILSHNHKYLSISTKDDSIQKIFVTDIVAIKSGKDIDIEKKTSFKDNIFNRCIQILYRQPPPATTQGEQPTESITTNIVLSAESEDSFYYWLDGLACLQGAPMQSPYYIQESECLLRLEREARMIALTHTGHSSFIASGGSTVPEVPPSPSTMPAVLA